MIDKSNIKRKLCHLFKRYHNLKKSASVTTSTQIKNEPHIGDILRDRADDVIRFASNQLKTQQIRDDFEEPLNLVIIVLGGVPPKGVRFRAPGAFHRDRWMLRIIYSIKIFLFSPTTKREQEKQLKEFICFVIGGGYIEACYSAPSAASVPRNDLQFITSLIEYRGFNKKLANAAIQNFLSHLWYI